MSMSFVRGRGMLMGAAMGLVAAFAGAAVASVPVVPKTTTQAPARRYDAQRGLFGGLGSTRNWGRRSRRGWSVAQGKRMAAKARNRARHRARSKRG